MAAGDLPAAVMFSLPHSGRITVRKTYHILSPSFRSLSESFHEFFERRGLFWGQRFNGGGPSRESYRGSVHARVAR
jgi:hypothetical protein